MHAKKYPISNIRYSILFVVCCSFLCISANAQYQLRINYIDKDSSRKPLLLQTNFGDRSACAEYINKLPAQLISQGYAAASVDSIWFDQTFASIQLYVGKKQNWAQLQTDSIEKKALDESNFLSKNFINKPVDMAQLQTLQQHILTYYEKNGYPFASIFLDSIHFTTQGMAAYLKARKGPLYHFDSIRVYGKVNISNDFLQRYLDIKNGSIYNIEKLQQVKKHLAALPYLQEVVPSDVTMLGNGSVLNLYLKPKPSSQIDFLIGFLPENNQTNKLQVTGNVDLDLKNSFGVGETILLNWQQLQPNSPKLNIGYQQPYIFKSPYGADLSFNLFKKDSSYLQINSQIGLQYLLSADKSGKLFFQTQSTIVLSSGIDTARVIATKTLPPIIDVSSENIGIDHQWNNTNYRFNPRTGNELGIVASVGLKNIKENSAILGIADTSFNYASLYDSVKLHTYQLRIIANGAHYFPTGKQGTLKIAANIGVFSSQSVFQNELFQIGGYKLMRGFDEESIYATDYAVGTAEYHYLVGLNSYFFGFIDVGWAKDNYQDVDINTGFIGTGIGTEFETKLGLLNISYAIGKRSDVPFNLTEASKIHFGYINYF